MEEIVSCSQQGIVRTRHSSSLLRRSRRTVVCAQRIWPSPGPRLRMQTSHSDYEK
jgi:hypothetical protein